MSIDRYVYHEEDAPTYTPAGHDGTVNRRLIGGGGKLPLGSRDTGEGGGGPPPFPFRPGAGDVCLGGPGADRDRRGGEGSRGRGVIFFPVGVPHRIEALGDPVTRFLIVYSPPLKAHPDPTP